MGFNPFDIAEQRYRSTQQSPEIQSLETPPSVNQAIANSPNDVASTFSPFDIAQKEYEGKVPEGWWDATVRNVSRTGSRMVETVLGLPGDLYQFTKFVEEKLPLKPPPELQGDNFIKRTAKSVFETLPTQQSLQELSENITGGYTAPQNTGEQISDEVFKTLSNLLVGGGQKQIVRGATNLPSAAQAAVKVGRNLGTAIASESAKEGVKLLGGSEGQGDIAKLGSLFVLGLTLPRLTGETNPETYLSSLYKQRDSLIPKGTMVTPTALEQNLQNFINNKLRYGGPTPEKTQVGNIAEKFLDKISGRAVEMDELLQMYRDINRNRASVMAATDLDKAGVKTARRYWGEVASLFNDAIEGQLSFINPKALELHRAANSGWASLNQSRRASDFIMDKVRGVPLKTGVATLFGGGVFYPTQAASALGGAAIGASATKAAEMSYRFMTNPTLRHYYTQVMTSALRENGPETVKAIKRLDDAYEREVRNPDFQKTQLPWQKKM